MAVSVFIAVPDVVATVADATAAVIVVAVDADVAVVVLTGIIIHNLQPKSLERVSKKRNTNTLSSEIFESFP